MSTIDYSPLGRAIARLKEGLAALGREPENTLFRDAVIHRFDVAFDLSERMLPRDPIHGKTPEAWIDFQKARGQTDEAYDDGIALKVVSLLPRFIVEVESQYSNLRAE